MKKLCVLLCLTASAAWAGDGLNSLISEYLEVQATLAGDNFPGAKSAAERLRAEALKVKSDDLPAAAKPTWPKAYKPLAAALDKALKTGDIDAFRAQFETISNAIIPLVEAAKPEGVHRYRCPMAFNNKGADWLQKGTLVTNPYFGSSMLRCGFKVKKK